MYAIIQLEKKGETRPKTRNLRLKERKNFGGEGSGEPYGEKSGGKGPSTKALML